MSNSRNTPEDTAPPTETAAASADAPRPAAAADAAHHPAGAAATPGAAEQPAAADAAAPDQQPGTPAGEPPAEPAVDPLAALQTERDQLHNQLQRTLADLQNFRKRRVQEMADARRTALEALVAELLPVLDNFHLALEYQSDTDNPAVHSMHEGLVMVRSLLEGVFERYGVREIPAAGETFDPAVHEAIGIDPDPDAAEGVVSKVIQRGYTIEDKVLRPTRVMVGGAPQTTSDEQEA